MGGGWPIEVAIVGIEKLAVGDAVRNAVGEEGHVVINRIARVRVLLVNQSRVLFNP